MEKKMKTRKWMLGLLALVTLAGLMFVMGCDGEKIGGGGLLQSFDRSTGQYN